MFVLVKWWLWFFILRLDQSNRATDGIPQLILKAIKTQIQKESSDECVSLDNSLLSPVTSISGPEFAQYSILNPGRINNLPKHDSSIQHRDANGQLQTVDRGDQVTNASTDRKVTDPEVWCPCSTKHWGHCCIVLAYTDAMSLILASRGSYRGKTRCWLASILIDGLII